jgi:deoxyuridine 5'-triphosphate nucleotidohydrolase
MNQELTEIISRHHHHFGTSKQGDVGHDLYVAIYKQTFIDRVASAFVGQKCVVIWPFTSKMVGSGIFIDLTSGNYWALILARSSTSRKRMFTLGGVIDSGYQGEYHSVLGNFSFVPRIVKNGERYAQVIFLPAVRPTFYNVNWFQNRSQRSDTGFGSTGK